MSYRIVRAVNGPAGLVLVAVLAALLLGALAVLVDPAPGAVGQPASAASPTGSRSPSPSPSGSAPAYQRSFFGNGWVDTDGNHCRTRDDVLARDLSDRVADGCKTLSGVLAHDPYTGATIRYTSADPSVIQIDHVLSLRQVWFDGAWRWTPAQRVRFANDPLELLAVDGRSNESKGGQGPGQWLPAHRVDACRYVRRFLAVKAKYRLPVHPAEREALSVCPAVGASSPRPEQTP